MKLQQLIEKILYIISEKESSQTNAVPFYIKFMTFSAELSSQKRNNILRKHKSNCLKRTIMENQRSDYKNLEAAKKKLLLSSKRASSKKQYNSMSAKAKEKKLTNMRANRQKQYNSMSTAEKERELANMRANRQKQYNSMGCCRERKRT